MDDTRTKADRDRKTASGHSRMAGGAANELELFMLGLGAGELYACEVRFDPIYEPGPGEGPA